MRKLIAIVLLLGAVAVAAQGSWLQAKAWLAQWLIADAWAEGRATAGWDPEQALALGRYLAGCQTDHARRRGPLCAGQRQRSGSGLRPGATG